MEDNTALKEFIRGGGATFITLAIASILSFFYKLILARTYAPSEYGLFEMLITILGIITIIGAFGLNGGLNRFIPLYKDKKNEYIRGYIKTVFTIQIITSILASVLLILCAKNITLFFNFPEIFTKMLYIIAIIIPFRIFNAVFLLILMAYKKVLVAKIGMDVIHKIVLILGAFFLLIFNLKIFYIAYVLLLSYIIPLIYYLFLIIPLSKKFKTKTKKYEIKRWFKYSLPLFFAGILGFLLNWTDNFVIAKFLTQEDLGIYGISFSIALNLFMGSRLFGGIFMPIMTKYYEKNKIQFKKIFQIIRNWTVLSSLTIGSIFILYSEKVLLFLFGEEYIGGNYSLKILTFFFLLTNYFYFSSNLLLLEEKSKKIFYGDLITLILNLIITIYLVNQIGIIGAAIGTGFSYFILRFYFHLESKRQIIIKHDIKHIIKCLFLTFSGGIISYIITSQIFNYLNIHFIFFIALAGIIYSIILIVGIRYLKILKKQDMLIIEMTEKYTRLNLNLLKKILYR
ncbi:MAG: oligosaccharide flippase family protein [Candidatus Woesearchaeota archaeon]